MSKILILLKHLRNSFHIAKILSKNNLSELIRIFIVKDFYILLILSEIHKKLFFQIVLFKVTIYSNQN